MFVSNFTLNQELSGFVDSFDHDDDEEAPGLIKGK